MTLEKTIAYAGWDARLRRPSRGVLPDMESLLGRIDAERSKVARAVTRDAPPLHDPRDPSIGKWAIVVAKGDADRAREAFAPLLEHRAAQGVALAWPSGTKGSPGILPVQPPLPSVSADKWIERIATAAPSDSRVPHHLLLIGGPDRISFEAQAVLDERFSTGRLDVGDTPTGPFSWEACHAYAKKVVAYETGKVNVERQALLYSFATDSATQEAYEGIALPLEERLGGLLGPGALTTLFGKEATTAKLIGALRARSPALVVTTSHGIEMPEDPALWGALTDQTFVGAAGGTALSASVVPADPIAYGAVILAFACFSAGVPPRSAHAFLNGEGDADLPGGARTAALPRALLAHPQGPVAFAGHVDRATSFSFQGRPGESGPGAFLDFAGWTFAAMGTLGRALSTFRDRAKLAASRLAHLTSPAVKQTRSQDEVVNAWFSYHDLAGYVLLGDPVINVERALKTAEAARSAGAG